MDCKEFHLWLENRDIYDLSEADRALRHSEQCDNCKILLGGDQQLDKRIREMFQYDKVPDTLLRNVNRRLESRARVRKRWGKYLALPVLFAVSLALFLILQPSENVIAIEALGRSVVLDHLDHGSPDTAFEKIVNIKQWSGERLNRPFVLKDLPEKGFTVVGGIICTINNCNFAHLLLTGKDGYASLFVAQEKDIHCKLTSGKMYSVHVEGKKVRLWKKDAMVYLLVA